MYFYLLEIIIYNSYCNYRITLYAYICLFASHIYYICNKCAKSIEMIEH